MRDTELFVAEPEHGLSMTVMETEDGHIYAMGSGHDCSHHDCPARREEMPPTTLGSVGPIEQAFRAEFGTEATELAINTVRTAIEHDLSFLKL